MLTAGPASMGMGVPPQQPGYGAAGYGAPMGGMPQGGMPQGGMPAYGYSM